MVRRFGEMIKIKPEGLEQYKAYHANPLPGVNEMIKACHLKNYSIYQRGDYMFTYYEYPALVEPGEAFDGTLRRPERRRILVRHGRNLSSGLKKKELWKRWCTGFHSFSVFHPFSERIFRSLERLPEGTGRHTFLGFEETAEVGDIIKSNCVYDFLKAHVRIFQKFLCKSQFFLGNPFGRGDLF